MSYSRIRRARNPFNGFTLVELLVVIGIIAVLIGILVPTLAKAREQSRSVKCLSNIKQLTNAMMMFAADRRGWMVANGGYTIHKFNPPGFTAMQDNPVRDPELEQPADWISWQRALDPIIGTTPSVPAMNITYSALAKYLGVKPVLTNDPREANKTSPSLEEVYRCPSDNFFQRNTEADGSHGPYRYSYAINVLYSNPVSQNGVRVDGKFNGKIGSIRNSAEKILLICEDEKTLNDGTFQPNAGGWNNPSVTLPIDVLSSRHMNKVKGAKNGFGIAGYFEKHEDAVGNVGFADGHASVFGRKDALRARYSGNPTPDPAGF